MSTRVREEIEVLDDPPARPAALRLGATGRNVAALHAQLQRAGVAVAPDDVQVFDHETVRAVQSFQASRGLETDGVCGPQTWAALDEARYRLGDRLLYLQHPLLRGDDVAELQQRLGALGFDAGRVDGIFGKDTARALGDFQRNAGVAEDVICGPDTVAALRRLGGRESQCNVATVRERELLLSRPRALDDTRLVIGEFGGADAVVASLTRQLQAAGAVVDALHHPDGSRHARLCNDLGATAYLGWVIDLSPRVHLSYFATTGFASPGGQHLAELLAPRLAAVLDVPFETSGRRLPVLRETRMPAVLVRLGPPAAVVEHGGAIGDAVSAAMAAWVADPVS